LEDFVKSFPERLDEEIKKSAVWKAAVGEPEELNRLLSSKEPLPESVQKELDLFTKGKLVPMKRKKGRPVEELDPAIALVLFLSTPLQRACRDYRIIASASRKEGNLYGRSWDLLERVANDHSIDPRALENALRNNGRLPKLRANKYDEAAPFRRWQTLRGKFSFD
jgi:hypothetical protein